MNTGSITGSQGRKELLAGEYGRDRPTRRPGSLGKVATALACSASKARSRYVAGEALSLLGGGNGGGMIIAGKLPPEDFVRSVTS